MPSRNKIVVGIVALLLLLVVITIAMWNPFKKSQVELVGRAEKGFSKMIETQEFSCKGMDGFTFEYALSEGWSTQETKKNDKSCSIFLNWDKSIMPSLPYIYVQKILIDTLPNLKDSKVNPNGIHYSRHVETANPNKFIVTDETDFYLTNEVIRVGLELYSEAGGSQDEKLNRELFWDTIIESFKSTTTP